MKKHRKLWKTAFNILIFLILCSAVPAWADIDGDGVADVYDNCAFTPNNDQLDLNGNNIGDVCEEYIDLLSQAMDCDRVSSEYAQESTAQICTDVTQRMEDGPPFNMGYSYDIFKSKGKYDVFNVRADVDSTQLSSLTLSIYVNNGEIDSQFAFPVIHVYAYDADADSVQSSTYLEFEIDKFGWHVLDLNPLLPLMDGFGFVKFRIASTQKSIYISEAYLRTSSSASDPDISVNPPSLDFGSIDAGTSNSSSFTVSNVGTADLIIGTVTSPSAPYSITSDLCSGQTLTPSTSCSVTVEFAPALEGTYADSVTIPSNDPDTPNAMVNLDGSATAPLDPQEISVYPTFIGYENVVIGTSSSQSTTVSNIGTADLVIGTITSPSAPYSIIFDDCSGQTIIPSASCTITVELTPTSEVTYIDSFAIPSNDADNPNVTVNLHGTGYIPSTIETIRPMDAYNPEGWIDVTNGYNGNLVNFSSKDTPNSTPSISFGGSSSDESVNAWQSKSNYWNAAWVAVVFERGGANDDTVDVVATDQNGVEKNTVLNAGSINMLKREYAKRLNMSDWGAGFSTVDNLRLRVNGLKKRGADGTVSRVYDVKIIGDSAPFVRDYSRGSYDTLPVDDSGLTYDYTPSAVDDVKYDDGTYVYQNAYTANKYSIHLFKYRAGTHNVLIEWIGQTLGISSNIYLEAYNRITSSWDQLDTVFHDASANDVTLSGLVLSDDYFDANDWIAVRVYSSQYAGTYSFGTDYVEVVSLIDTWQATAEPTLLNFGSIDINTSSSLNVTVTNTGVGDLVIGSIGSLSSPYSITSDGCSSQTLPASAQCFVTVEFAPTVEGNFAGSLTIPSNDADNPDLTVNLNGTAVASTLTGTVTDASTSQPLQGVTVTVTDSASSIQSDSTDINGIYTVSGLASGNYTADYTLLDYFPLTINGTLAFGQTLTSDVQLTPVAFTISSPADGAVLDTTPATVTGFVESNSTVTVNGIPATVTGNSYSASVPLVEGQNTITAIATDQFNQTQTLNISVTLVLPITVTITSPLDGATVNSSPVTVSGDVFNFAGSGGYAEARAQSFKPSTSGALTAIDLILTRIGSPGGDIYIRITNEPGGNPIAMSNMVSAMSLSSIQAQWKTFVFPAPPQVTAGNTYYMELWRTEYDDVNYVDWWNVHGQFIVDYYSDGMGYRSDSGAWTDLGPYVDATFQVYVDSLPDVLQDYWSASSPHMVVYGINPYPVDVTVNGVPATVTDDTFSASVPLTEGPNTITAAASDQYGHSSTDSLDVTLITPGTVTGTVTDSTTGLPVDSADVSLTDSLSNVLSTATAADGTYTINGVSPGSFSGYITKDAYSTYNFADSLVPGQTMTIDAALDQVPPVISNVTAGNITGDSAIITWTTDHLSDSVVEYGTTVLYGDSQSDPAMTTSHSISLSGLTPGTTYHFRVTSTNSLGLSSSSADDTFLTVSPITVSILIPSDNDTISRPDVVVRGVVSNSTGNETGVTVNGIVATVYNGEFAVNGVPLVEGQNTITASAVDTAGNVASHTILLNALTTTPYVKLKANVESGIAPLTTYFSVSTSIPNSVVSYSIDFEGDSIVDYTGATFEDISFTYATEGVYFPTVNLLDDQSNVYSDSIVIIVLNQANLDALLQAKWGAMKTALLAGDVTTALSYFVEESKDRYNTILSQMNSAEIDAVFSSINELKIYSIKDRSAQCGAIRVESGGTFSYPVTFMKDEYGLWKLMGF